jgi:hypothetical protein
MLLRAAFSSVLDIITALIDPSAEAVTEASAAGSPAAGSPAAGSPAGANRPARTGRREPAGANRPARTGRREPAARTGGANRRREPAARTG